MNNNIITAVPHGRIKRSANSARKHRRDDADVSAWRLSSR